MAYGKVHDAFWSDSKMRSLPEDARNFFLYLLTNKHKNRLGCYVLDQAYAAADTQWSAERVQAAIEHLRSTARIGWDAENRVVFLPRWFVHNTLENRNVATAARGDLRGLPDTPYLVPLLHALIRKRNEHLAQKPAPKEVDRGRFDEVIQDLELRVQRYETGRSGTASATPSHRDTHAQKPSNDAASNGMPNGSGNGIPNGMVNGFEYQTLTLPDLDLDLALPDQGGVGSSLLDPEQRARDPELPTPPPPGLYLERLRNYVGDQVAPVVGMVAELTDNPEVWAMGLLGLYGPAGTEERLMACVPEAERIEVFSTALIRYATEATEWHGKYFRGFVEKAIGERVRRPGTPVGVVKLHQPAPEPEPEITPEDRAEGLRVLRELKATLRPVADPEPGPGVAGLLPVRADEPMPPETVDPATAQKREAERQRQLAILRGKAPA